MNQLQKDTYLLHPIPSADGRRTTGLSEAQEAHTHFTLGPNGARHNCSLSFELERCYTLLPINDNHIRGQMGES
jgi:hypothetical protein